MKYLRQSTAATVAVGPFLQIANGYVPVTNLTTSSTLNGRAVSNGTGAAYTPGTFTHDANGHYLAALATGDVPSVGRFRLEFSDPTTYLPVWEDFTVLSPAVYDALFGTVALSTYAGTDTSGTTAILAALNGLAGLIPPGTVSGTPTSNQIFTVNFGTTQVPAANLIGQPIYFRSGANITISGTITAASQGSDAYHVNITAITYPTGTNYPTPVTPTAGDGVGVG